MRLIERFIHWVRDHPNTKKLTVGGEANPTYWRYFVVPRNPVLNFYLHHFLRDDEEDLHTHRMINISIVLDGPGYEEDLFTYPPVEGMAVLPPIRRRFVARFIPRVRLPSTPHRVVLLKDKEGRPIPVWSLFIGLPHWQDWWFWCPGTSLSSVRKRPWQLYTSSLDPTTSAYGERGRGCE